MKNENIQLFYQWDIVILDNTPKIIIIRHVQTIDVKVDDMRS